MKLFGWNLVFITSALFGAALLGFMLYLLYRWDPSFLPASVFFGLIAYSSLLARGYACTRLQIHAVDKI